MIKKLLLNLLAIITLTACHNNDTEDVDIISVNQDTTTTENSLSFITGEKSPTLLSINRQGNVNIKNNASQATGNYAVAGCNNGSCTLTLSANHTLANKTWNDQQCDATLSSDINLTCNNPANKFLTTGPSYSPLIEDDQNDDLNHWKNVWAAAAGEWVFTFDDGSTYTCDLAIGVAANSTWFIVPRQSNLRPTTAYVSNENYAADLVLPCSPSNLYINQVYNDKASTYITTSAKPPSLPIYDNNIAKYCSTISYFYDSFQDGWMINTRCNINNNTDNTTIENTVFVGSEPNTYNCKLNTDGTINCS